MRQQDQDLMHEIAAALAEAELVGFRRVAAEAAPWGKSASGKLGTGKVGSGKLGASKAGIAKIGSTKPGLARR